MGYITQDGLKALKQYKYVSGGYSKLDMIYNHWWEFFVKLIPLWVAPNLITLLGLCIQLAGCVNFLLADTTFTQQMPPWYYYVAVLCNFLYQTLDAVDGKQARRTGTSSPLGQLFDHGCDAVCTFIGLVGFLQTIRAGTTWVTVVITICITLTFYTQQWEEYHAHVLRTFIGNFGVTEGLLITQSIILSIGLTNGGLAVWTISDFVSYELPWYIGQLTMPRIFAIIAIYNGIIYASQNISYGLSKTSETKTEALLGLLPLPLFYAQCLILISTDWAWKNPALAILLVGPSYCLMTCRHIICSVCKMKYNYLQKTPAFFLLFLINRYPLSLLPYLKNFQVKDAPEMCLVPEEWVAFSVFFITLFLFLRFTVGTIYQITSYLDIYCLTIKHKKPEAKLQ